MDSAIDLIAAAGGGGVVILGLLTYIWTNHNRKIDSLAEDMETKVSKEDFEKLEDRLSGVAGRDLVMEHVHRIQGDVQRLEAKQETTARELRADLNGAITRMMDRIDRVDASLGNRIDTLIQLLRDKA